MKVKESEMKVFETVFVRFAPLLSFIVVLIATVTTVSPSVAGGDSGELLAEGCTLGTPHPPGYPTYMLLTYAVASLTNMFGRSHVAYSMNLTSCLFGALTSALITKSIILLFDDLLESCHLSKIDNSTKIFMKHPFSSNGVVTSRFIGACSAITASLMCSFSPLIWLYSITSEVFAMNNLFVSALVCTFLAYAREKKCRYVYFGAFLCGFSLTNQVR